MNEEKVQGNPINPAALDALTKDLESLKKARASNARERHAPSNSAANAAVSFMSAMAVCSILGYGVDYALGTLPLGLLVGLVGGAGLGTKLILNAMKEDA